MLKIEVGSGQQTRSTPKEFRSVFYKKDSYHRPLHEAHIALQDQPLGGAVALRGLEGLNQE